MKSNIFSVTIQCVTLINLLLFCVSAPRILSLTRCKFMQELQKLPNISLKEAAQWACVFNETATYTRFGDIFFDTHLHKKFQEHGTELHWSDGDFQVDCKISTKDHMCPDECMGTIIENLEDDLNCARFLGFNHWYKPEYQRCFNDKWINNIVLCTNAYIPLPAEPGNHEIERDKLVEVLQSLTELERRNLDEYFSQPHIEDESEIVPSRLESVSQTNQGEKTEVLEEGFRER
uniref:CSON001810 protein n=1 Tax=Culicoides sonorensis TaxID=179676 RepID=A0A336K6V9_CULSO